MKRMTMVMMMPMRNKFFILNSVIRFGKISPLWQKFTGIWQLFDGLFFIWQNAEYTLAHM